MRYLVIGAASLAIALSLWGGGTPSPAEGSHTFQNKPPNYKDFLWYDLEGDGLFQDNNGVHGDQRITYSSCTPSPPASWSQGIEDKWDAIFTQWDFEPVGGCTGPLLMDWEGARGFCAEPTAVACLSLSGPFHENHVDITSALILFDVNHPQGHTFSSFGPNWQVTISAHEWGHVLGLMDHDGVSQCGAGTLMGQVDVGTKATDNPCYTGPTAGDRDGVTCVAYDWCGSAPMSGDFDGDGRTDLLHICCTGSGNLFYANTDGTFTRYTFQPWAGYSMGIGDWRFGDFNADGRTDILRLCCADFANLFLATNTRGVFNHVLFQPWPGYAIQQGVWRVGDFDADGRSDLAHLCCTTFGSIFYSNGGTTFTQYTFQPWAGYGMQGGVWLSGNLNGSAGADLVHICCQDYGNLFYFTTTRGSFVHRDFRPAPGYAMQQGIWQVGNINSDSRTDLLHVCCADYGVIFYFGTVQGSFTPSTWQPWAGYGMQQGQWRIANLDGAYGGDIVHLCCDSFANLFYATGTNGVFTNVAFSPGNVRFVRWRDGLFDSGNARRDLVHVCCVDYGAVWLSGTAQGSFNYRLFQPWSGYGMQQGKWR